MLYMKRFLVSAGLDLVKLWSDTDLVVSTHLESVHDAMRESRAHYHTMRARLTNERLAVVV